MRFLRLVVMVMLAAFMFAAAAEAATVRITQPKLKSLGIAISKFGIVNIFKDGRIVTGYEKVVDTKLKQQGTVYKLWVFDFSSKKRENVKISEILLPCTIIQNAALSHDGKTCIVTAERGSKFIKVDIPSKKATVLCLRLILKWWTMPLMRGSDRRRLRTCIIINMFLED